MRTKKPPATKAASIRRGSKVIITERGGVAVVEQLDQLGFTDVVPGGTAGVYAGVHKLIDRDKDFHVVEVELDGKTLLAPVHRSQFAVTRDTPSDEHANEHAAP